MEQHSCKRGYDLWPHKMQGLKLTSTCQQKTVAEYEIPQGGRSDVMDFQNHK